MFNKYTFYVSVAFPIKAKKSLNLTFIYAWENGLNIFNFYILQRVSVNLTLVNVKDYGNNNGKTDINLFFSKLQLKKFSEMNGMCEQIESGMNV